MQYNVLSRLKSNPFRHIMEAIDQLALKVQDYLQGQMSFIQTNYRQDLCSFTYEYLISSLQGNTNFMESETQSIVKHIIQSIREFKIDLFQLAASNPQMAMFDFLVSQQFNDLYDVLTASQEQLRGDSVKQPSTPQKLQNRTKEYVFNNYKQSNNLKIRSNSLDNNSQDNKDDIQFTLLQQYIYDNIDRNQQIGDQISTINSPRQQGKRKNETAPQLFSFDSTFLKDLPFSKFNQVSNFDEFNTENKFNFTLHNQSLIEEELHHVVQTSRFEDKPINEEDDETYLKSNNSSSDLDDYYIKRLDTSMISQLSENTRKLDQSLNEKLKMLAEKEKQVAQRELKTIISEKHLLNRALRDQMHNNKENQRSNSPEKINSNFKKQQI